MKTYRVVQVDDEFQVVETTSPGRRSFVKAFSREDAAQSWLDNYLRLLNLNNLSECSQVCRRGTPVAVAH
jgi:hypothetical protein